MRPFHRVLFPRSRDRSWSANTQVPLQLATLFVVTTATAHAQNGCVDSPECPTAVLGLIGAAAIALARRFKR